MAYETEMDSNTAHVEIRPDILRKLSDVIDRKFKDECRDIGAAVILEVLDFLKFSDDERLEKKVSSDPPFAVVYIAVILLFFAASVFVVLVKYMRKESESSRLEHFYQNYQDGKRARLIVRYDTEGRPLPIKTAYSSARRSIIPLDIGTPSPTPSEVQTPLDTPNSSIATVPPLGLLEHDL